VGLQHSAINWQSFSVPAGNTTHFQQPSAASTVINRVVTNVPSQLFGTLSSNGHLVLVNQAGIAVGAGALVDTAGFTASALRMTDADALAGRLRFGDATVSTAGVSVQGRILARSGDAVLIGSNVDVGQDALIQSPNGSTLLAAGQQVEITGRGLEGISFQLQAPTDQALNLGKLSGNAVGIFAGTLKHSGQIRADAVTVEGGKVVLKASRQLDVAGQVSAQALNQRGGAIQATAPEVLVQASAVLDASGAAGGGELLLGGGYQGKDARLSNAQTTTVEMGAQLRADAITQGDGGTVIVWADDTARVHGSVSARGGPQGGDGGFIETSGKRLLDVTQAADAAAPLGKGGTWLLDPYNVSIGSSGVGGLVGNVFTPSEVTSSISASTISAALSQGANVVIETGDSFSPGYGGNISVTAPIFKTGGSAATLTLRAANDIYINDHITSDPGFPLNLSLQAGGRTDFNLSAPVTIDLAGGALTSTAGYGGNYSWSGSIKLSNGALTINNAVVNVRELELSGGSLGGSANVSVSNSFTQTGGVINKTGSLSINQASGALALGNITVGSLSATANGNILQTPSSSLVISGATNLTATGGNITLEELGNDFNPVVFTSAKNQGYGGTVLLRDLNSLVIGNVSSGVENVNLVANQLTLMPGATVSGNHIDIQPNATNRSMQIGGVDPNGVLYLSAADISNLNYGTSLRLGSDNQSYTGTTTVSGVLNVSGA
jgi:filamentous hemagglutinin family protein